MDAAVVVGGGIIDFLREKAGAGATPAVAPGCMDFLLVDMASISDLVWHLTFVPWFPRKLL